MWSHRQFGTVSFNILSQNEFQWCFIVSVISFLGEVYLGWPKKKEIFLWRWIFLVWFFLTKPYKNELAISYLWSQDFLWWKIILVGKLTGCCEIYPFELSSAMSGDVVTEYTLWRTLLGKYCVMIYFVSHLPLWLCWLIFCLTCMPGPPLCRTYTCDHLCEVQRWHLLSFFTRWTCTVQLWNF